MASNCRTEAALKMEVVSFFERVLLTNVILHKSTHSLRIYDVKWQDAWSCWARQQRQKVRVRVHCTD
jgi:hypothetical protein